MKPTLLIATAVLAAACGRGADQSHNSSQAGAAAAADPASQPDVSLIGCLQNADRVPAGPTATAGRGSAGGAADQMNAGRNSRGERFTLTNARSQSSASRPSASSYILDGNLGVLREHVNQQVRVKGQLDAAAANTAGPQRVRVESLDVIDPECAGR